MRSILPLVALLVLTSGGGAQQFASDNFDSYVPGALCYQAGCPNVGATGGWDGWYGAQAAAGVVVDGTSSGVTAHSGNNYLDVTTVDAVLPLVEVATNPTYAASTGASFTQYPQTGAWTLKAYAYVPTGGVGVQGQNMGWFILNSTYIHLGTAGTVWAAQVQFYDDGAGNLMVNDVNGSNGALPASYDTWIEIQFDICLDNNTCKSYVNGALLGDRLWTAGAAIELANIDLFSSSDASLTLFGQIFFDTITLTPTTCPAPLFQTNTAESTLDLDGAVGSAFSVAKVAASAGVSSHLLSATTTLVGTGADIGFVAVPAVPSNGGGIATAGGQAANINIFDPSLFWLFTPSSLLPNFLTAHPGSILLPFTAPPVPLPLTISAQQVCLDPGHPDFFRLSSAVELNIEVCPTGIAVGFENPNWGAPNAFLAGWTVTNNNPNALNTWRVTTAGTPSGGTGPTAAFEGNQYIYYESSCPNTTGACGGTPPGANIGILESPPSGHPNVLSTAAVVNPALSFAQHALGNFAGSFRIEQYNPTSTMWDVVYQFTGAQSSSAADWRSEKVNLINHGTGDVQVRFVHDGGPSTTWQSDWCIDAISICEQ